MRETPTGRPTVPRRAFLAGLGAATAGCTRLGRTVGSGGTTVVWNAATGFEPDRAERVRQALHDAGGLPAEVTVEIPAPTDETVRRVDQLRQRLGAGEATPDVFSLQYRHLPVLRDADYLRSVASVAPDAARAANERFLDPILRAGTAPDGGELTALPLLVEVPAMCYRRDLATAAGYSPGTEDWATEPLTWEAWSHVVADVRDHAGLDYGVTTQWDRYLGTACCTFNEVLSSWGGAYFGGRPHLFGPVGDRPVTVDADPAVRSLGMMRRFVTGSSAEGFTDYAADIAPAAVLDWTEEQSRTPMAAGRAVAHRNWPYALRRMGGPGGAFGRDLGAMPIPYARASESASAPGTGGTTAALGGTLVCVNRETRHPEAVRAVLRAMTRPAFQRFYAGFVDLFPPDLEQWTDGLGTVPERYLPTLRVAAETAMPQPATRVWGRQAEAVAELANAAVAGEQSPSAATSELATTLAAIEADA